MSEWETVDEQPLSDWLMPHERADLERSASQAIVGFVPRDQVDERITQSNRIEGSALREARLRKTNRRAKAAQAYRRKTDG